VALFSPNEIKALLAELLERLNAAQVRGGIRVVGGAAIAMLYGGRAATADIDASLTPSKDILEVARQMATERSLPMDWLNDKVLAFIPFEAELTDWLEVMRVGETSLLVAKPHLLLAMKLRANRGLRDASDIEVLLSACKISSMNQVETLYEHYFSQEVLSFDAERRVRNWLTEQR
jgi:hypothetical protein